MNMNVDMCVGLCVDIRVEMGANMCADTCIVMCVDIYIDMRMHMYVDTCMVMYVWHQEDGYRHVCSLKTFLSPSYVT